MHLPLGLDFLSVSEQTGRTANLCFPAKDGRMPIWGDHRTGQFQPVLSQNHIGFTKLSYQYLESQ